VKVEVKTEVKMEPMEGKRKTEAKMGEAVEVKTEVEGDSFSCIL
jgi:hypothetical protein